MEKLKEIIESLLFVAETTLTIERIKQVTAADTREISNALQALADEYESRRGGFHLNEVAGGYQIRTRPEYNEWIKRLIQPNPPRVSKAALETLAIIAYKQPVIRSDIEYIRGVDSGGVLRLLLERKLIRVLGRKEIPGRPLIYATTKQFLEVFDLKDLKDLPTPREIESFGRSLLDESPPKGAGEPEQPTGGERPQEVPAGMEETFADETAMENSAAPEKAFKDETFFDDSVRAEETPGKDTPPEDFTGSESTDDDENRRENT
jgi:segregation and condensation protein B